MRYGSKLLAYSGSGACDLKAQTDLRAAREGNRTARHVGPTFTDAKLLNTGVVWRDGHCSDAGDGCGAFKTSTLREVALAVPYMHDGSLATLGDVIEFCNGGGRANINLDPEIGPLRLTDLEKRQLEAFLRSLSGQITEGL